MYVAMATAVHMDYTLPLKNRVPHFKCFCKHGMGVCWLFAQSMQLHTHQIYRNMEHF